MTTDKPTPEWVTSPDEGIDPFALPTDQSRPEPLKFSLPTLDFAERESNPIQKELLHEVEGECLKLHDRVTFYPKATLSENDLAQYSREEAKVIIEEKSRLNAEQARAVLLCENDLCIQALAGTGKTSFLSAAISYLIAIGVAPEQIAICSHTVTAAEEIKGRILPTLESLFPRSLESLGKLRPSTGTIHALAYREMLAHRHPKAKWTILDEAAQYRIWREARQFAFPDNAHLNLSDDAAGEELRLMDRIRGYDIPTKEINNTLTLISQSEELAKTADFYQKVKEARKLMDYTDLLREWAPLILHTGYRKRWDYVFVDEFQDTNPLQKFLLKLLKLTGSKLIVCGDNRQSINSFTGSDPTSHNSFFREFGIKETWLETNYRCSHEVIGLANSILASMSPPEEGRLKAHANAHRGYITKMVFTNEPGKAQPKFLPKNALEAEKKREAEVSCREAITLVEILAGELPKEEKPSVALLYRTNAQGTTLEEAMVTLNSRRQEEGLPPIRFTRKDYRRTALRMKTEREILEILSAWANPQTAHWEGLLLSPYFVGIGEVTARTIQRKADRNKPQNAEETALLFEGELSARNAETIGEFFLAWENARNGCAGHDEEPDPKQACRALESWIQRLASKKELEKGSKRETEEAQKRAYETGIFERIIQKNAAAKLKLSEAIAEVVEENERANQIQNNANKALGLTEQATKQEKEEGIILSTIHLAKGREYDGVVIHQVSRGSLPHFNALRFYDNPRNTREKGFRKFALFPNLQKTKPNIHDPDHSLPEIGRTGKPTTLPRDEMEAWEDINNPLEEEKRLLYVAITRAKRRLTITSKDGYYEFLPKKVWEKLKKREKFTG